MNVGSGPLEGLEHAPPLSEDHQVIASISWWRPHGDQGGLAPGQRINLTMEEMDSNMTTREMALEEATSRA